MTKASQLTAQLYSLRDFLKMPADIEVTLKRVRKIGYENVQLSGIGPIEPAELKRLLDQAGLLAVGHHTSLQTLRDNLAGLIKDLQLWGCRYTAVAYLGAEERQNGAAWKARAKEMTRFGKLLRKEGITLQYHNHSFEMQRFGGMTGLEILYANSDPRYLQAEIDTHWIARGGGDPAEWCACLKGRLDQVHLKDASMLNDQPIFAEIGEGNLNWPAILKACKQSGVKHYIVEQDSCPITNDPFKSLAISYKNLRLMGLR
ncbi:MAG: sugar phosphate isomerase/epimerase [bacterium]